MRNNSDECGTVFFEVVVGGMACSDQIAGWRRSFKAKMQGFKVMGIHHSC